jgi:FkbM family methyltransferase
MNRKISRNKRDIRKIKGTVERIARKLSMADNIVYVDGVKFWVPNFPADLIQRTQADGKFFEQELLEQLDSYMNENSVVLDIGANVGNHTVYWSRVSCGGKGVRRVYSFEPISSTFAILKRNFELNGLDKDRVVLNNVGLGRRESLASVIAYDYKNIGGTILETDNNGAIRIISLDEYLASGAFKDKKIDFVKIDVEGFEEDVLVGARKTLDTHSPIIWIEAWKNNFEKIDKLLNSFNYKLEKILGGDNYLYIRREGSEK